MKRIFILLVLIAININSYAYDVCVDGIYYNIVPKAKEATVTCGESKYSGSVIIPEKIISDGVEYIVTSIGSYAFSGCSNLTRIDISGSVMSIGDYAFRGCSNLTFIDIPNIVTSIGDCAFSGCSNLTHIAISSSVKSIGACAFSGCSNLTRIDIPGSVKSIGAEAFISSGIKSIYISDINAWVNISHDRYKGCGLTGYNLYLNNVLVQELIIPETITSISNRAFDGCKSLRTVNIPQTVTSIGYYAFSSCSGLVSVSIPNSVTNIEAYAFYQCPNLTFDTLPNSLTAINYGTFYGTALTSVNIPNSVTSIGGDAFKGCSNIKTIKIGSGIKNIYSQAFAQCQELESVYCNAENVPSTWTDAFSNSYVNYSTLYVPEASLEAYKSTAPWNEFGTILPIGVETPVASITINAESNTVYRGDKATLTVTVLPEDATDKTVAWSSSNSDVVSVDSNTGEITAVGCGEAVITATAIDGSEVSGSLTITVKNAGYELVDGTSFSNAEQFTCDQLTYTRTFSDTNWQALYVPFSMQYDDWKDNFEIARLNDAHQFDDDDDGVIDRTVLESVKLKEGSKTEPNTPYMIKAKTAGEQTITLTDAMVYPAAENSFDVTSWFTKFIFTGTYHTVTDMATAGHYAMAKGGLMQATSDAATLGSFRWYLDVTDRYGNPTPLASKSIRLSFDDGETTDIDIINADSPRHAEVYSISGIQLKGKLPKGLYISNGKKVVIK